MMVKEETTRARDSTMLPIQPSVGNRRAARLSTRKTRCEQGDDVVVGLMRPGQLRPSPPSRQENVGRGTSGDSQKSRMHALKARLALAFLAVRLPPYTRSPNRHKFPCLTLLPGTWRMSKLGPQTRKS